MAKNLLSKNLPILHVDQLRPGLFVHMPDLNWMEHPFFFNSFRLTSEKQIKTLLEMGIRSISYDPARSTVAPLPLEREPDPVPPAPTLSAEDVERIQEKQERMAVVLRLRNSLVQGEKDYRAAIGSTRSTIEGMLRDPVKARHEATLLVQKVASQFTGDGGVTLTFIAMDHLDFPAFQHATNVMILSLTLGKAAGLDKAQMEALGLGAMLHDLGKVKVPPAVLNNEQRNPAEEKFYQMHVDYGVDLLEKGAAEDVLTCIRQHHERADGKGFPEKRPLDRISILARIVAIANRYDNLCNPLRIAAAMTPAEALSRMFAKEVAAFDRGLLTLFVKQMGVYPPGSFVQLSNGAIGMVVSVNPENSLKPGVMMYEPGVPRGESLIVDLSSVSDVKIEYTLKPQTMDQDIVTHLNPRMRTAYYPEKR
jgi:HD-GYP domain-containing protein (c-di-GMP phosphodiesterase class II)